MLPSSVIGAASLRGNEYAWPVNAFTKALEAAVSSSIACLGGQFQFRLADATCEMYWLEANSGERNVGESWPEYVRRSNSEVMVQFQQLLTQTNFRNEASRWSDAPELSAANEDPQSVLYFCAYFISEHEDT